MGKRMEKLKLKYIKVRLRTRNCYTNLNEEKFDWEGKITNNPTVTPLPVHLAHQYILQ